MGIEIPPQIFAHLLGSIIVLVFHEQRRGVRQRTCVDPPIVVIKITIFVRGKPLCLRIFISSVDLGGN
jgi:hypothetical protein